LPAINGGSGGSSHQGLAIDGDRIPEDVVCSPVRRRQLRGLSHIRPTALRLYEDIGCALIKISAYISIRLSNRNRVLANGNRCSEVVAHIAIGGSDLCGFVHALPSTLGLHENIAGTLVRISIYGRPISTDDNRVTTDCNRRSEVVVGCAV